MMLPNYLFLSPNHRREVSRGCVPSFVQVLEPMIVRAFVAAFSPDALLRVQLGW